MVQHSEKKIVLGTLYNCVPLWYTVLAGCFFHKQPFFVCLSSEMLLENLELIKFICNYKQYIFPRLTQYGVLFDRESPRLAQIKNCILILIAVVIDPCNIFFVLNTLLSI